MRPFGDRPVWPVWYSRFCLWLNRLVSTWFSVFSKPKMPGFMKPCASSRVSFFGLVGDQERLVHHLSSCKPLLYLLISLSTLWFCCRFVGSDKSLIQQMVACCWLLSLIFRIQCSSSSTIYYWKLLYWRLLSAVVALLPSLVSNHDVHNGITTYIVEGCLLFFFHILNR